MTEVFFYACDFCATVLALRTRSIYSRQCPSCGCVRDFTPISYNRLSHQFQVSVESPPPLSPLAEDARDAANIARGLL